MSGFDITPAIPAGRQVIQAYGDGLFRIAYQEYRHSVIVRPDTTEAWAPTTVEQITLESLAGIEAVQILLVGCGKTFEAVPKGLRAGLKDRGIVLEWMDTGAACRTFNVLLSEDRSVAAALIAV